MTAAPKGRRARLAALLGALSDGRPHSPQDLAAATRIPPPLAALHLDELCAAGYPIRATDDGRLVFLRLSHLPAAELTEAQLNLLRAALSPALKDPTRAEDARTLLAWIDRAEEGYLPGLDLDTLTADLLRPEVLAAARHLPLLRRAVAQSLRLTLTYADTSGRSTCRPVRPLGLERWGGRAWALIGWCEMRSDFRSFRLDRIEGAEPDGTTFAAEPGRDLATFQALRRQRD